MIPITVYIAAVEAAFSLGQKALQLLVDANNGVKHTPEQLQELDAAIQQNSNTIQSLRSQAETT